MGCFLILDEGAYQEALTKLNCWAHAYYVLDQPLVSDAEYGYLYREVQEFEDKFPLLCDQSSPTQRVGDKPLDAFKQEKHKRKMASLMNAYSFEDVDHFVKRLLKQPHFEDGFPVLSLEPKVDGLAVSLLYEKGRLVKGITRGDGFVGEDVTQNIKTIRSLPLKISYLKPLEIRGEVYMSHKSFNKVAADFVNPRNAAAGSLRQLNPKVAADRFLSIFVYQGFESGHKTHCDVLMFLRGLGFPVVPEFMLCKTMASLQERLQFFDGYRSQIDWDMDGVVIKVNDLTAQESIGATGKAPRWAIAYKFEEEKVQTCLNDIILQVGRTGILTPVAILQPVKLSGVTIKRASLHNFDEIQRLGIQCGDDVWVQRSGEVIPKVIGVAKKGIRENFYEMPKYCPSCSSPIEKDVDGVAFRCTNYQCVAVLKGRLRHFVSRKAMNIDGFGSRLVDNLVDIGLLKNLVDCYRLTIGDLLPLEGFAEKSAASLIASIQKSKSQPFSTFLFALGIPFIGQQSADLLTQVFTTLPDLMRAKREELMAIHGIGETMVDALLDAFSDENFRRLLDEFLALGMPAKVSPKLLEGPLSGETILVTGALPGLSRDVLHEKLEAKGAQVATQVSKKLTLLLVGDKAGSKLKKVKDLNEKGSTIQIQDVALFVKKLDLF